MLVQAYVLTIVNTDHPIPTSSVCVCVRECPRFLVLRQNGIHQTSGSASANLLLAMLWSGLCVMLWSGISSSILSQLNSTQLIFFLFFRTWVNLYYITDTNFGKCFCMNQLGWNKVANRKWSEQVDYMPITLSLQLVFSWALKKICVVPRLLRKVALFFSS